METLIFSKKKICFEKFILEFETKTKKMGLLETYLHKRINSNIGMPVLKKLSEIVNISIKFHV